MKVSDYIVDFLIQRQITHVFGYPGGMVTHLMDSLWQREEMHAHVTYHEQGAAFAACGYAQVTGRPGVAYATSGPGATNLLTGLCNAYFDSLPVIFMTGQVNRNEGKNHYGVRQRGFQETDIVNMVRGVTKYAVHVDRVEDIRFHLEKAYAYAMEGRKGPVLLDIPMDVFRSEMEPRSCRGYLCAEDKKPLQIEELVAELNRAKRPCIIAGAGVKPYRELFRRFADQAGIPVVTSMLAVDVLPSGCPERLGFLGAYGSRCANFVLAKSDCILSLGARLDIRQVGGKRENFAPMANVIRVEIDAGELSYPIKKGELQIQANVEEVLAALLQTGQSWRQKEWLTVCRTIQEALMGMDEQKPNQMMRALSQKMPDDITVVTDVGQNQVWAAQSLVVKPNQQVLFSGGHGAMGYSLPASIGAYYGTGKPVVSLNGDGGIQMNIQELQVVARDRLPIKIVIFNNYALGMIRHFQEMYFDGRYAQTVAGQGYQPPDFQKIAAAYGLGYSAVSSMEEAENVCFADEKAEIIEVLLPENTYVFPKLEFGKPNQDQQPLIDRALYQKLMEL